MAASLKLDQIQLGDGIAANNLVIKTNDDGTFTIARGNIGGPQTPILSIDADGVVTPQKFKTTRTWQTLTGSRAAATDYTNDTLSEIIISINAASAAVSASASLLVDGVARAVMNSGNANALVQQLTVAVPPGSTYRLNLTSASINSWHEFK